MNMIGRVAGLAVLTVGYAVRAQQVPEMLTDTTGYVLLNATDAGGTSSFNTNLHWSDDAAPEAGKHYLVNGNRIIRILATGTFAGDSLSLDNGRIKSGFNGGTATINDLRIYGGRLEESVGNSTMTYAGNIHVYGTASNPARISGCSTRTFYINSTLHGDETSAIKVMMTEEDNMDSSNLFWCRIQGDNAATYSGRFIVEGNTQKSNGHRVALAVTNLVNLGKGDLPDGTSVVTLRNRGMFFGRAGAEFTDPAYSITIESSGGTIGSQTVGGPYNCGVRFANGFKIRGDGVLYVYVGDATMVMDDVDIQGPPRMEIERGTLRTYGGYNCPDLPIRMSAANTMIAGYALNLGAVTMENGATLSPGFNAGNIGTLGMAGLTVNGTANLIATIHTNGNAEVTADYINVKGNLTKGNAAAKILFKQDYYLYNYEGAVKAKLLSAKNLGEADGFTVDDFEMTYQDDPAFGSAVVKGFFSIEDDPEAGTKHLYWTSTAGPLVRLTGADGNAPTSFTAAGFWENAMAPSDAYDYIVPDGKLLRARAATTFAGKSLAVGKGGDFAINGVTATVNDLRLFGGGHLTIRNDGTANILRGTATVTSASSSDYFEIEIEQSSATTYRRGTFENSFTGDGNIRFGEYHGASANKKGEFFVSGDNSAFTGRIRLQGSGFTTEFKDAAALGGAPATFIADALNFVSNAVLRVGGMADSVSTTSYTFDTPNRGVQLGLIGGIFQIAEGLSLTIANPVSGSGKLTKTDAGDLVLAAANSYSGATQLSAGRLVTRSANALGTGGLTLAAGTSLRIEGDAGLTVKTATPFTLAEGEKLALSVSALDTIPCPKTQILLLPDAEDFDLDLIQFINPNLNGSILITRTKEKDDAGVHIYVKAIPVGTQVILK
ncbi:MAG: autotransporter-associated beta strand repeat-containing protein [Kiritimatiellae bacterium]|nr:autotransporter-associated beta strand repeat-containing protein [Kiritimatiellia bacterium]